MSHKKLRPFIVKVSVFGYFPLCGNTIYIYIIYIIYMSIYSALTFVLYK